MNDKELRTYCREHAGEELPAAARALLGREPELQREVDRQIAIQQLMALKNHEQPDAGGLDRCLRAMNARIDAGEKTSLATRIREWFIIESPVPAYAYAAAALVVAALGATLLAGGRAVDGPALAEPSASPAVIEPVVFAAETTGAETNEAVIAASEPVMPKPIIMLRVNADEFPANGGGLTFGGDASVPVSYER